MKEVTITIDGSTSAIFERFSKATGKTTEALVTDFIVKMKPTLKQMDKKLKKQGGRL